MFAEGNSCYALNRDAIRKVFLNHQLDYYHNLMNVCDMTYEATAIDAVKTEVVKSIEAAAIGPINILKGID
jgi:hypothetical protein